jgi:soluble lytic murein transglycosylase-like protein
MSATISLKQTMARRTDAALHLVQHSLMIVGLILVVGLINLLVSGSSSGKESKNAVSPSVVSVASAAPAYAPEQDDEPTAPALLPRMQGALEYVTRRYRVSPQALLPVFEAAQMVGNERRIDPLLIVAVIGVESGFNPFAESATGAQGLMQVIPRFHLDKIPDDVGDQTLLDPVVNIRVGVHVLQEAIRRRGGLIAGLQYYAGSSDGEGNYAARVLAEKERLEHAARRGAAPNA